MEKNYTGELSEYNEELLYREFSQSFKAFQTMFEVDEDYEEAAKKAFSNEVKVKELFSKVN
jgi:DNA-binding sugar fermentation-stimulating protein